MVLPTEFHRHAGALGAPPGTPPPGRPFPSSRRMLAKRPRREPGGGSLPAGYAGEVVEREFWCKGF